MTLDATRRAMRERLTVRQSVRLDPHWISELVVAPALTTSKHWSPPATPGESWRKVTTNDMRLARWALDLDGLAWALVELGQLPSLDAAKSAIEAKLIPALPDIERAIADCLIAPLLPVGRGRRPKRVPYRETAARFARYWYPRVLDLALAARAHSFDHEPTYRDVWTALTTPNEYEYIPLRPRERMLFEVCTKRGALPLWELWLRHWPRLHPADKIAQRLTALDRCEELATVTRAIERYPHSREIKAMREARRDEHATTLQIVREEFQRHSRTARKRGN